MKIRTGDDIHVEIADNSPDRSVMTELEFKQSIKDDNKRCLKKWVAVGDLEKLLTERIREEKRKKRTPHRLGITRALSFVRRTITNTSSSKKENEPDHVGMGMVKEE